MDMERVHNTQSTTEYPKLIVFDLDLTLCEHRDSCKIHLGIASRTEVTDWATELLHTLQIHSWFDWIQIYPGSKKKHYKYFAEKLVEDEAVMEKSNSFSQVYHKMIFYDDKKRNIHEIGQLGVSCVHCEEGLNIEKFMEGLKLFKRSLLSVLINYGLN
ncbi:hypothetical protein C9374_002958 [Naegleria lovaniensis]|uniref:Uncharacterized protein n=1 Tax=Naegleria lovaniensis TaxID=51637 RepID=A0AA88KLG4_NAELO|nr:uncharacterized protein C9374_002958 [Naegleria lovaniensis]KAG2385809.1 hypothetical protein C9374_002958 [Naegleria lovaniensis]